MSNTNKITPLRRKAKASDYEWSEEFQAYVLTWADRLGRGVVCSSPEDGAKEYNEAVPRLIKNKETVEQRLSALVEECLAEENERTTALCLMILYRCKQIPSYPGFQSTLAIDDDLAFCFTYGQRAKDLKLDERVIAVYPELLYINVDKAGIGLIQ